jgi:hypothetical protein
MKKLILLFSTCALLSSLAFSQGILSKKSESGTVKGSGNVKTEFRNIDNFSSVNNKSCFNVTLIQADRNSCSIATDDNILQFVEIYTKNDVLYIETKKGINFKDLSKQEILITAKLINSYTSNSSGNASLKGLSVKGDFVFESNGSGNTIAEIECTSLDLSNNGSGNLKFACVFQNVSISNMGSGNIQTIFKDADIVDLKNYGSGDVKIQGLSKMFTVNNNGSGNVYAVGLKSEIVQISCLGSGNVDVYAIKEISIKSMGSGDVAYRGNPEKSEIKNLGSGKISN